MAFAQIRQYGARDAPVAAHLATTRGQVAAMVPPELRASVARQGRLVVENARAELTLQDDVDRVEQAALWLKRPTDPSLSWALEGRRSQPAAR